MGIGLSKLHDEEDDDEGEEPYLKRYDSIYSKASVTNPNTLSTASQDRHIHYSGTVGLVFTHAWPRSRGRYPVIALRSRFGHGHLPYIRPIPGAPPSLSALPPSFDFIFHSRRTPSVPPDHTCMWLHPYSRSMLLYKHGKVLGAGFGAC